MNITIDRDTANRQRFLVDMLLLAYRAEGPDSIPRSWDNLVRRAYQYGRSAVPRPTPAEFDRLKDQPISSLFSWSDACNGSTQTSVFG